MPLPNIGLVDGNTGRSEGATAEKAVPFPCAVLDPIRSFVELRVREPLQGLVAFRIFVRTPIRPNYRAKNLETIIETIGQIPRPVAPKVADLRVALPPSRARQV
jgi:hypothetical protein